MSPATESQRILTCLWKYIVITTFHLNTGILVFHTLYITGINYYIIPVICYHDSWSLSDHYLFHHVRFYSVGVIIRTVEIQCMESLELWGYSSFTLSNLRITISVVENLFHYHSKSALYHWPCLHHIKTTDIFMSFNTHILHLHSFSSLSYRLSVIHYHYFYR